MKKFSTAAVILALAAFSASLTAPQAFAAGKRKCEFRSNAPDQHVVVKGDTLWGISGKFLDHPWCWPQVWGMNREQIRNPHWIYPGQIVYFDRANRRLRLGKPAISGDERLSPRIRITESDKNALPSIDPKVIEPFLSQALIIEEDGLAEAPRIVASQEGRVKLATGDRAYVRGDLKGGGVFNVFRPGQPLKDPVTKAIIAYEAEHVGVVQLVRLARAENEAHAFTVIDMKSEMGVGDRLVLKPPYTLVNYVPHPPEMPVEARVASIYGGVTHGGQHQVVALNRGKNDGLDVGTVLKLYRLGETITDRTTGGTTLLNGGNKVKLPDEESGTLFVFRVFNNVSYALIMDVNNYVVLGDVARSPE